ncbi:MAG TPA: DUF4232 domain-containing protein [Gaiellaceae bacterium]|nr:DUF4232 domain-containing protein [Gaiellaceae bacterium]
MIAPPRPPSRDELELLIKEARARQLRRRLLGAAGVAIAAAFALGVYAIATGGSARPTADHAPRAGAPVCRSSQLSGSAWFNGATGSLFGGVMISDTSHSACSLPHVRPVVRISSPGRQVTIRETAAKPLDPNAVPRLAHGAMAQVYLEWSNWCGKPPTALTLRFGHDLQVAAPLVDTQPPCVTEPQPLAPSFIAVSRLLG